MNQWRSLIWEVAQTPALAYSGVRKIASDVHFQLDWMELANLELGFSDICYTKSKFTQLDRNYWNSEDTHAAFDKLVTRKSKDHTSVSVQLQNKAKDGRSQGFCMQNMVITQTKQEVIVDVYYRSTEVIQKFLADLIFFSHKLPPLFDDIKRRPSKIRFHFANVYLSAVFMPVFIRFEPDALGFFKAMKKEDPKFFRTCGLATRRFFDESHNYSYRTRVKMHSYWKEHVDEDKLRPLQNLLQSLTGDIPDDDEGDDE